MGSGGRLAHAGTASMSWRPGRWTGAASLQFPGCLVLVLSDLEGEGGKFFP